nr:(E)-beta-ocimene synthase, chloroplastic-like [Tanacetum cinerariifolium]
MKEIIEKTLMELSSDFENCTSSLSTLQLLELIDNIERLSCLYFSFFVLSYRFPNIISKALEKIASIKNNVGDKETQEFYAVSLKFRLLRQHGYNASQEFLIKFMAYDGGYMECLQTDIKGLITLYEVGMEMDGAAIPSPNPITNRAPNPSQFPLRILSKCSIGARCSSKPFHAANARVDTVSEHSYLMPCGATRLTKHVVEVRHVIWMNKVQDVWRIEKILIFKIWWMVNVFKWRCIVVEVRCIVVNVNKQW